MDDRRIGRYRIEGEPQGRGGMGTILRGLDEGLDRIAAIKLLPPGRLASDPDAREALRQEARAVARLKHPHIAALFEFAEDPEQPYLAMEWVDGESLQERLARGALELGAACRLFEQILGALDYAHSRGVLHGDIKPANLMLSADGQKVTLVDFGLATLLAEPRTLETGPMLGTPLYLPPEIAAGEKADGRADLYSAALVFFEMVSGKPAFGPGTVAQIVSQHLAATRPILSEHAPSVPLALDSVMEKAMARQPSDRFATGAELWQAVRIAAAASTAPGPTFPAGKLLAGIALLVLVVLGISRLSPGPVSGEVSPGLTPEPTPTLALKMDWGVADRDAAGSNAVEEVPPAEPVPVWRQEASAPGSLALAEGLLLVQETGVVARRAGSGEVAWRWTGPLAEPGRPILSPREAPTRALVRTPSGWTALSLKDGKRLWEAAEPPSLGAVLSDDDVLYLTSGSSLRALDASTGERLATTSVDGPVLDVAPVIGSSVVFLLTADLKARAFDDTTLKQEWSVTLPSRPSCMTFSPQGHLMVGCLDGQVLCYSLVTRKERWELGLGDDGHSAVLGVCAVPDLVLVTYQAGELAAYNNEGYPEWQVPLAGPPAGPAQTDGERVLVALRSGQLLCLDAYTSRPIWTRDLEAPPRANPLTVDGWIFLSLDTSLAAFRSPSAPLATP